MKKIYFFGLFLAFTATTTIQAQTSWQLGTYFTCDIPNHRIMPNMSTNAGIGLQLGYRPIQTIPVSFELKSSIGSYSMHNMPQTYYFSDSSSTTTNVSYSSSMNKVLFGTRFTMGHDFRLFRAYFTPQIGAAFMRSKIVIADPQDEDDCRALERKTTQRSSGFIYGGELGGEIDMRAFIPSISEEGRHRLFASVNFMNSFQPLEYVNIKHMKDHHHGSLPDGGAELTTTDANGRDITTTFINVSTNSLHEHKIAELYKTSLQYWGFSIGYTFSF